jgi:hypothetical protein
VLVLLKRLFAKLGLSNTAGVKADLSRSSKDGATGQTHRKQGPNGKQFDDAFEQGITSTGSGFTEGSEISEQDVRDTLVAFDENLLEKARTQWQFGDWETLAAISREELQHHPDRAKLALLVAAGHSQLGDMERARQFTRLADDWGIDVRFISKLLCSNVHNSLARAALIVGNEEKSSKHFNHSLKLGYKGDTKLLLKARMSLELANIKNKSKILTKKIHEHNELEKNIINSEKKNYESLSNSIIISSSIENNPALKAKFLYIHINKCGGTSVKKALSNLPILHIPKNNNILNDILEEKYDGMIKFTIVREPVERFKSLVRMIWREFGLTMSVKNILELVVDESIDYLDWSKKKKESYIKRHGLPMSAPHYGVVVNGVINMDYIFKIENIDQDWKKICMLLNIKENLEKINTTLSNDCKVILSDECMDVIYTYYKSDFTIFEYKKDRNR